MKVEKTGKKPEILEQTLGLLYHEDYRGSGQGLSVPCDRSVWGVRVYVFGFIFVFEIESQSVGEAGWNSLCSAG